MIGAIASHFTAGGGGITDPRGIPGLVAWYSADAVTGVANGANMTAANLSDLSGAGNHPVSVSATAPIYETTTGPAGGPAIRYNGSGGAHFNLPNLLAGATSGEIMATVITGTGSQGFHKFGTHGSDNHYPFSGVIYDDFGSTTRQAVTPGVSITVWRRYNAWSAPGDWSARLDESVEFSTTTNTVAWSTAPKMGTPWGGNTQLRFGCVVIYNRKLTAAERADLAAWLAANPSGGTAA